MRERSDDLAILAKDRQRIDEAGLATFAVSFAR